MQCIQDGMMQPYMVSSIKDLLNTSRTRSCCWTSPKCSNNSRPINALKCDTCYWECQGEKAAPSGWARQSALPDCICRCTKNQSHQPWYWGRWETHQNTMGASPPQRPLLLLQPDYQLACPRLSQ